MWSIKCRDLTSLHIKMWLLNLLCLCHGNCTRAKGTETSNLLQNDYPYITMWITFLLMAASALAFTIIGSTQPMKLRAHACKSNLASIWCRHLLVPIFNVHFPGRHANVIFLSFFLLRLSLQAKILPAWEYINARPSKLCTCPPERRCQNVKHINHSLGCTRAAHMIADCESY